MRPRTIALAALLGTIVVVGVAVASQLPDFTAPLNIQPPWAGPVHLGPGAGIVAMPRGEQDFDLRGERDGRDQPVPWMDIVEVGWQPIGQMYLNLEFGDFTPDLADLESNGTTFSYGFVFETTGDGVADYEVGLSNDAPKAGDFVVWVTNLATGETEQQVGPPYGFPVEFRSPMEEGNDRREAVFTFLGGSLPPGVSATSRFYAWSVIAEGGKVVARDFAPDAAWFAIAPQP